jgi:hypothetical protein
VQPPRDAPELRSCPRRPRPDCATCRCSSPPNWGRTKKLGNDCANGHHRSTGGHAWLARWLRVALKSQT